MRQSASNDTGGAPVDLESSSSRPHPAGLAHIATFERCGISSILRVNRPFLPMAAQSKRERFGELQPLRKLYGPGDEVFFHDLVVEVASSFPLQSVDDLCRSVVNALVDREKDPLCSESACPTFFLKICFRVKIEGHIVPGELAYSGHLRLIKCSDLFPGAGDGCGI